jgi:hypothetical protein
MAPAQAEGDALEWLGHWTVRTSSQDEFYGESEIEPDSAMRIYVLKVAKEQLEKLGRNKSTQDSPEPHYHVLLYTAGARQAETKFDLQRDELEKRVLEPYRDLRPIVIGGRTLSAQDLQRVEIFRSERSSQQFNEWSLSNARSGVPGWYEGETDIVDVTDELITTPSIPHLPHNADAVELLCSRFHAVAKQLRVRRPGRATLGANASRSPGFSCTSSRC